MGSFQMASKKKFLGVIVLIISQNIVVHGRVKEKAFKDTVKDVYNENEELIKWGAKTAGISIAVIAAVPVALAATGFGAAGVVAGTVAASVQSAWFGGAVTGFSGVVFSALQTMGAVGLGAVAKAGVVTTVGVAVKKFGGKAEGNSVAGGDDGFEGEKVPRYCKYSSVKGELVCKDGDQ